MANQIADNVGTASAVTEHIQRFWDPVMRRDLAAAVQRGAVEVSPIVEAALGDAS